MAQRTNDDGLTVDRLLQATPEAVVVSDEDGVVTRVNAAALDLYGADRDTLVGADLETLFRHEAGDVGETFRQSAAAGEERFHCDAVTPDGRARPCVVTVDRLVDRPETRLLSFVSLREDDAVGQGETGQPDAISGADDGVALLDAEGRYVDVNAAHADLYGFEEPAALVGEHWGRLYDDAEAARLREEAMTAVAEQGRWRGHATGRRPDGSTMRQDLTLTRVGDDRLVCVVRDLGDRGGAGDPTQRSDDALRALTEVIADADQSLEERISRLLDVGREHIGLPYAFLTRLTEDTQFIERSRGDHATLQAGASAPRSETYCRVTADGDQRGEPLAVRDAEAAGWGDDPAYERFDLGCYLGQTIEVEGEVHGTVCFAATEPRAEPFTEGERTFVDLIARWIGGELARQRRKEDLWRTERRFEAVFDDPEALIGLVDPDGSLLRANQRALAMVDLDESAAIGEPFWDLPWWNHDPALQDRLREHVEAAADGEFKRLKATHVTDAGEERTVDVSLRPVRGVDGSVESIVVEGRDVTTVQRHEQRLTAINKATDELLEVETPVTVAETVVGITEDLLDRPFVSMWQYDGQSERLLPLATSTETRAYMEQRGIEYKPLGADTMEMGVFESGEVTVFENYGNHPDRSYPDSPLVSLATIPLGEYGMILAGSTEHEPFTDEERELLGSLAQTAEVALGRAVRREERDAYRDELERSNEELQQFAYVASHDLQEPLRMVSSYVDLLEQDYGGELDAEADEYIEYAVDGADRMRSMINALLEYSRVHTRGGEFERVDSGALMAHTVQDLTFAIEDADAEVVVGDLPSVKADPDQLGQVFLNLVENALEYGGEGPTVEVWAESDDERHVFHVADDGPGIETSHQDDLFEIFTQGGRGREGGTGIGLAVCRRIVERHGGDIQVDSAAGEGATFTFTLPARTEEVSDL